MPLPAMAFTFVTLFLIFAALIYPTANAQSCFFPNGTDANRLTPANPQYLPCNAGDPVSMCCHIGDSCRSDGLCLSTSFDGNVWRDLCTDKTWQSPNCVKLCVAGTMAKSYANNPRQRVDTTLTVTPCGDGSYCCGNGTAATNCCDSDNGLFIDENGNAVRTNPTSTASRSAVAASSSKTLASVAASLTVTSAPAKKKRNYAGLIAGVVIAAVVVLAGIAIGAFITLRKRKRVRQAVAQGDSMRKRMNYSEMPNNQLGGSIGAGMGRDAPTSDGRIQGNVELDGDQRHEIQDEHMHTLGQEPMVRHELGS